MLAHSKFGMLLSFLFASVEYAFVVCLLGIEQVKDNTRKLWAVTCSSTSRSDYFTGTRCFNSSSQLTTTRI